MATHSSILAWKIPWAEELGELQSVGVTESDTMEHTCTNVYYTWNCKDHMYFSLCWEPSLASSGVKRACISFLLSL